MHPSEQADNKIYELNAVQSVNSMLAAKLCEMPQANLQLIWSSGPLGGKGRPRGRRTRAMR
jgi:hypothetical protein